MSAPFVGRGPELAALESLARSAGNGRAPAAALIVGEPGSGKSRLLAELRSRPSIGSAVRVTGFEPTQSIPLAAAADLLRRLATAPVDGPTLDELVFRGRGNRGGQVLRIYEAARRASGRLGPLGIAIDDLQWIDDASLGLVDYLLRAAETDRRPILVLAASRPSPAAATFEASLEAIVPEPRRRVVRLGPLSLDDGRHLVQALNRGVDGTAAAELWRQAGGSPFWLIALARRADRGDPGDLIEDRLRSLGRDAGELLAALAVGARPLRPDEIGEVLGWPAERVEAAIRELSARGLVGASAGTVAPAHDLIRESAAAALPARTRQQVHARFAGLLETGSGDELPALREALGHRTAAGLPVADLARRLLESPQRRLLAADDLHLLAGAADHETIDPPMAIALDRGLAELAAVLGEQDLALERWRRVSRAADDPALRQAAELEAARAAYALLRADEAHDHIDRARAIGTPSAELAVHLDALQADVELWLDHRTDAGSRSATRALAAAEAIVTAAGGLDRLSDTGRVAFLAAAKAAGDAATQEDRGDETRRLGERILEVARGLDEASYLDALIRVAFGLRTFQLERAGHARYREAWDLARRLVLPIATLEAGQGLVLALRGIGELREAREVALETAQLEARILNAPRRWGNARAILHAIELMTGAPSPALAALRDDAASEPNPHFRLAIHQIIAVWQARTAGPRAAAEVATELDLATADARLARCPRCTGELEIVSVELLAKVGRLADAEAGLAVIDAHATSADAARRRRLVKAQAAVAAARGDHAAAAGRLADLAEDLEAAGLREELAWVRLDLGRSLAPIDRARSVEELTKAAELAEEIGSVGTARLAAGALRAAGVRAWRRGRAAGAGGTSGARGLEQLSGREREVAGLVAAGRSNREIADELVVAPKTVERHVTNILAKLGARNRTEMAALLRPGPDGGDGAAPGDGTGFPR